MYVIGTDVGTTGTKTVVLDENGKRIGKAYKEYELKTAPGGRVMQNAQDWWDAVVYTIKESTKDIKDKENIKAIGFSTQGASMLAVDRDFNPLCDVITWMDKRAVKEAAELDEKLGKGFIYSKCGWGNGPTVDAPKIMWIRNEMPDVYKKAKSFVSTVEFVNFRLTGNNVIDPTNAGIRAMFDVEKGDWDEEILSAMEIDRSQLPKVQPTGSLVGTLTKEAAKLLGLSEKTEVYNGAHDQYCASLGSGAVKTGDMLLATGTTWVILGITEKSMINSGTGLCVSRHPSENAYGALASLVAGGSTLKWYKQIIDSDFKIMDDESEKRRESAKNLFFFPYLAGSSIAHKIKPTGGVISGIEINHDKFDISRVIMESVGFETSLVLDLFKKNGIEIKSLMMTGGAAKSRFWAETTGYITGCDIYRSNEPDVCPVGAAILAAVGCGIYENFQSAAGVLGSSKKLELADKSLFDYYREKSEKYKKLVMIAEQMG